MGVSAAFGQVASWENLLDAYRKAALGKRGGAAAAAFDHRVADRLIHLQQALRDQSYRPGAYVHFQIKEPKRRTVSAAPFRDRVAHHALCNVIEPRFERRFISDSYANRFGKGTHRAVDRAQQFARSHRYVLRMDIVKHFPCIDHLVLRGTLRRVVPEDDLTWLIDTIIASGEGILDAERPQVFFPGDDLLSLTRPCGLPIGNLTSQFWSNCLMDPFDQFVKRELRCRAYLRYVDDFALFSDSKRQLWAWKRAVIERLGAMRLCVHEGAAQVLPVTCGIPWLGFIVYPTHRRVKARNVRNFSRRLQVLWSDYCAGRIGFGELNASVKGWVNHVRFADSWGLRRHIFRALPSCRELTSRGGA